MDMENAMGGAKTQPSVPKFEKKHNGENVTVQGFSSRYNTPRIRLSNEAWEHYGLGPFSSENVPFVGKTGMVFAEKVIELVTSRLGQLEQTHRDAFHLYEFGTGTGLLSKHILDILKDRHPDIYKTIQIHISDISPVSIQRIKETGVFQEHEGHIVYEIVDAASPRFSDKPLLVYHTYLANSLPTRHIEIINGKAYEIQIKTLIKKGARIVDTTQDPPIVLDEEEIAELLNEPNSNRRKVLAPRILAAIEECYFTTPIEQTVTDPQEKSAIEEFVIKQKFGRFNYSHLVNRSIRKIIDVLKGGGGMMLISDCGRTQIDQTPIADLISNFGVIAACPVDFPVLVEEGTKTSSRVTVTSHRQRYPQEIMFDTIQTDKKSEETFVRVFKDEGGEVVDRFLEEAGTILQSKIEDSNKSSRIKEIYAGLPEYYKLDFQLLNNLSYMLVENGLNSDAVEFSSIVIKDAGYVCGPSFRIRSRAFVALGKLVEAEEDLKKAISISEMDSRAYAYLANLYRMQQKHVEYIEAKKGYLRCTRNNDILQTMTEIADAQDALGNKNETERMLGQIVQIADSLGNAIDPQELKAAQKVRTRIVG